MPAPARAEQVPGGSSSPGITHHLKDYGRTVSDGLRTAEREETYMARRGSGTGSHDPPGSAVPAGKDSDEALHRTIQMMPFAGKYDSQQR